MPHARINKRASTWIDSAVIYGVVPHNFGPYGFRSITERLDALQELGIDALWLSPCNKTPGKGHGYAVTDYFSLRPDYGTKRDFRTLVRQAHSRGLRILMDFVPNHTSIHHPYLRHTQRYGRKSPYFNYYDRKPHEARGHHFVGPHFDPDDTSGKPFTYYFHWKHLPNLNYDNPKVRRLITDAFLYWVREFGVDGFRIDAAWGVQLRRPDFWPRLARALRRVKPDLLLLAEASACDPYWFANGFDAAYDWTGELGVWAWEHLFDDPDSICSKLHAALTNNDRGLPKNARVFRFLNNNDTGERFLTRHGLRMERLSAALLLTLPGLPCIYTGQEVGAEFHPYRNSSPISWDDRHNLRPYYQRLISLRKHHPSLHSLNWETIPVESSHQVYAYARYSDSANPVLVALNFNRTSARAKLTLTQHSQLFGRAPLVDLLSDKKPRGVSPSPTELTLRLPPLTPRILTPAEP